MYHHSTGCNGFYSFFQRVLFHSYQAIYHMAIKKGTYFGISLSCTTNRFSLRHATLKRPAIHHLSMCYCIFYIYLKFPKNSKWYVWRFFTCRTNGYIVTNHKNLIRYLLTKGYRMRNVIKFRIIKMFLIMICLIWTFEFCQL